MNSFSFLITAVLSLIASPACLILGAQNGHFGEGVVGALIMILVAMVMGYIGERTWVEENRSIRMYRGFSR